ncbi:MAG TPA: hypothetical protein VFQ83_03380 [Candidatus Udaeobacter sp.]|jgi:hypothetical protein|nr:hypothetical protein [Candidatus Udaeobacter sp.]
MNSSDAFLAIHRRGAFSAGLILSLLITLRPALSQTPAPIASSLSPDKQWEYRCDDGLWSSIVKTDTNKTVLDLSNEIEVPYCQSARVIWAPDSKRFAFNYSPPHAPHTTYETVAFYQLHGDKWIALASPVSEESEQTQLAQLSKEHSRKNSSVCRADPSRDILIAREWPSVDTAILYAPCYKRLSGELQAAFLFSVKFDNAGNCKIVKTHRMSQKEVEEEDKE